MAVPLINLNIVYQCMPFVRFDGYWALADLTGILDFSRRWGCSYEACCLCGAVEGTKIPNLKSWVKIVFVLYVVVTVPVLSILLFLLITSLPR